MHLTKTMQKVTDKIEINKSKLSGDVRPNKQRRGARGGQAASGKIKHNEKPQTINDINHAKYTTLGARVAQAQICTGLGTWGGCRKV